MNWSKLIPLGFLIAVGVFVYYTQPDDTVIRITGSTMGTTYEVTVRKLPPKMSAEEFQQRIEQVLADVNQRYSHYDPNSEISQFNQSQSTDWHNIEPESRGLYEYSQTVYKNSGGAFDITLEPLILLWNFSNSPETFRVPTEEQIEQALSLCGTEKLMVRRRGSLKKSIPELQLNLSAIAKGYGVDQVAELLRVHHLEDFLVNIGGEIYASGTRDGQNGWRLGIEKPIPGLRSIQQVIELQDVAMATSGSYRNFFEVDGVRYSHTIDPRTGRPVKHKLHSVSVLSESCLFADAWATAIMVMGPEEGMEWALENHITASIIYEDEQGQLQQTATPDFPNPISPTAN